MKMENFSKAMNEMFGVGGASGAEKPAAEPVMADSSEPYVPEEPYEPTDVSAAPVPAPEPIAPPEMPVAPAPDSFAAAIPYSTELSDNRTAPVQKTILAAGTTFVGNMTVQGDVDMDCDFQGDIQASGTVTIRTKLAGDLSAKVVELVACEVQGDIHADESVRIDGSSKVIGNITGKDLNCAGSVQGNIQVSGHVTVSGSAYIEGDLEAASIAIENGAGVNGQMQVLPGRVQ